MFDFIVAPVRKNGKQLPAYRSRSRCFSWLDLLAGGCEVVPRCSVVGDAERQSELRGVLRRCGSLFSCEKFNGFGKAFAEKLHDKIKGDAAAAYAVAIPFVASDGQAVVPFPAIFLSGAFQRFPL